VPEHVDELSREVDRPPVAGLWCSDPLALVGYRALDPESATLEVEVLPPEGSRFAQPEPAPREREEEGAVARRRFAGRRKECLELVAVHGLDLLAPRFLRRHQPKRLAELGGGVP